MTKKKPVVDDNRYDVGPLVRSFEGGFEVAAVVLGVEVRTLHRWCVEGVAWVRADEIAIACGRHPAEVWGEDWLVATGNPDDLPDTPLEEPGQLDLFGSRMTA